MRNTTDNITLVSKIDDLAQKRHAWEAGTYKSSNEELCRLLEECLTIFIEVRGNHSLVRRVSALMAERNLTEKSNTSLETRIVRLVFGECGNRAFTYARVLTIAAADKAENESMVTFINNAGGIENLRRRKSNGAAADVSNNTLADFASEKLAESKPIVAEIAATSEMVPDTKSKYQYSVALIATSGTGHARIVYTSKSQTLVRSALVKAGKQLKSVLAGKVVQKERESKEEQREEVLNKIAA